eukprot:TRINITY_DN54872_c0_g1_i1.p1 TRINITY_DN54872_c0_g1~~TRINITY_DN54872_c0_g1_i1.p1  ORF type:complete len:323 (+),score=61.95 TRINITY_DN54872_c0_g1_i1:425-1393(+)
MMTQWEKAEGISPELDRWHRNTSFNDKHKEIRAVIRRFSKQPGRDKISFVMFCQMIKQVDWIRSEWVVVSPRKNKNDVKPEEVLPPKDWELKQDESILLAPVSAGGALSRLLEADDSTVVCIAATQGPDVQLSQTTTDRISQITENFTVVSWPSGTTQSGEAVEDWPNLLQEVHQLAGHTTLPQVFIRGKLLRMPSRDIYKVDLGPLINPANHSNLSATLRQRCERISATSGMATIRLAYEGQVHAMEADPSWVGAIFKSKVMQHLGAEGRFSDFVVTLDHDGEPCNFRGREPIGAHPGWSSRCIVVVRSRKVTEAKPVGTT